MSDAPAIQPRLVVQGRSSIEEYPILEGRNMIGWSSHKLAVDIDLNDPDVSHEHARITFENNQMFIEDLFSDRGTSVDGLILKAGTRYNLRVGAIIQIGAIRLEVQV